MTKFTTTALVLGALTFGWTSAANAATSSVNSKATQMAAKTVTNNDLPGRFGEKLGSRIGLAGGALIGAEIGLAFGPFGAIAGAFIGGLLGETLGSALGEGVFGVNPARPQVRPGMGR